MVRQYYFDEDFAGAEYRAVIDLVGRKAHFVGLVFSVGLGREERLAFEGRVSELGGIVIERMPFLKNRIDLRHPAALELLPAAERERLGKGVL